jgi:mannose-1-phosphate guanylyltransferase/mannose-1-phosphate guanylyltransferase/mannose-6-phosphate isomerase
MAGPKITPVLLCGGSGTRLWPLSRASYPKQFSAVLGDETLFAASARRFSGNGFTSPVVITANDFRFIVQRQLDEAGVQAAEVLIEPAPRNTAPACALAALAVQARSPGALVLLVPSDHAVPDAAAFRAAVATARAAAEAGQIVTFGIRPTRPETGYGWLEPGDDLAPGVRRLVRFVEKPDPAKAEALLAGGRHLWNAGVFLARADVLIEAFRQHAPAILDHVAQAYAGAEADLGFTRIDLAAWAGVPEDSIDYAVMEKAQNLAVVAFDGAWSDLGSWDAVWQESARDDRGNALSGQALALDCDGSLLRSEAEGIEIVGIGLSNIAAIAMSDAVLVTDLTRGQDVKVAVQKLKARKAPQATQFPVDHRPWGWFETLVLGDRFQVKRIHVNPGAALSLQSHMHRSEHWIVVQGTARVTVGDQVSLVAENQSVYIPLGAKHRMENPGKVPMVLIEVQTGSYLGEDDIIRYEDIYARK